MTRTITFNGNLDPEAVTVDLFGKPYTLKQVTKTVQKQLEDVQDRLNKAGDDPDADGNSVVEILVDGIDALLKIDGAHKTPAKKVLQDRWNADALSLNQIQQIFEGLQDTGAEARPT